MANFMSLEMAKDIKNEIYRFTQNKYENNLYNISS